MIDLNTKTSEVIDRLKKQSACVEAVDWMEQGTDLSWDETLDRFLKETGGDQSWAIWYMAKFGKVTVLKIRKKFIAKISDPMMAFQLYLKAKWLTDKEDKLLEAKFKGKLPTAEAELAQGIVKRNKWQLT